MDWSRIDALYLLCHREKESNRWQRLEAHLYKRGIPHSKVVPMAPTWGDQLSENVFSVYDPFLPRPCPFLSWKGRALSLGEISLVLNFWSGVDHAIQNQFKTVIFFESDVFLRDDFCPRLGELLNLLKPIDWDFVSLSDGVGTHAEPNTSVFAKTSIHKPPHQCPFRCTDSMLFNVDFLRKIRGRAFPFRECLDWELNYQLGSIGGKAFWVEPHLVEQGTSKHRMTSLLPA